MGHHTHDDVARRWMKRALYGQQSAPALDSRNLHDEGDIIYSYGHHFEVGRILRDDKRRPVGWLLNGNTYSPTTTRHQQVVRSAVQGHGLPVVIIPHAALDAAGIDRATVQIIDVQQDWNTETVITRTENPGRWQYEWDAFDDNGGWINSRTGEFFARLSYNYSDRPKQETCEQCAGPLTFHATSESWEQYSIRRREREVHVRARHGVWEEVPASRRRTGRKSIVSGRNGNIPWDIVDDPTAPLGYVFERVQRRHWLGASLIRAAVNEPIMRTCRRCGGTGQGEERWVYDGKEGLGPLTEDDMTRHLRYEDFVMERNGGIRQPVGWTVETYARNTDCRGCGGTGRVRGTRRRWAYYLSGFDLNETRPSYFFCELPKSQPATVEEAYEVLKPDSVKLAESMGREVKRQGDIFAIPMPTLETRTLKRDGEYRRMPKRDEADPRRGDTADIPYLLDTNHAATEVVTMGGYTYARGMLTHAPAWRAPDHKRVKLGNEWHLIVKNTVPIGA
jgi:hypothetical protein